MSAIKIVFMGLLTLSSHALANDTNKIALAKQAVFAAQISPYASPSLQRLIDKAKKVDKAINPDGVGCEFVEHVYLGYGNDSYVGIHQLQATVLTTGVVQATWIPDWGYEYGNKQTIDFLMTCHGNHCVIDDVQLILKDAKYSIKKDAWYMIKNHQCP